MQPALMKILNEFSAKVRRKYPNARIWAFGSHARGTATAESDLDVCVVLSGMQPDDRLAVSDMAWEVGFENEMHLTTIVISESDFEKGPLSVSPLLDAIRSEGVPA